MWREAIADHLGGSYSCNTFFWRMSRRSNPKFGYLISINEEQNINFVKTVIQNPKFLVLTGKLFFIQCLAHWYVPWRARWKWPQKAGRQEKQRVLNKMYSQKTLAGELWNILIESTKKVMKIQSNNKTSGTRAHHYMILQQYSIHLYEWGKQRIAHLWVHSEITSRCLV